MININQAFIDKYFKDGFKYSSYLTTVELYNELKIHFDGEYPYKLIDVRRPNENEESKEYRKQIYQPKTKACCTRITNSLSKIRRSPDWLIKFTDIPASIPEDESPEIYINDKFPFFGSLTTWIFSICLKNYLIDSNALCVVAPLSFPEDGSLEYVKPFPRIYNSPKIIDYVEKEYAVVESNEKSTYTDGNVKYYNGRIVLIITTTQYVKYEQTDTKGGMTRSVYYNHNIGELPAFKLKGQYKYNDGKDIIWESRISGILPDLNEFVRMYSDFQAQIVQHVFSEKWVWEQNEACSSCKGTGYFEDSTSIPCKECNGSKRVKVSPFGVINVKTSNTNLGQSPSPIPPGGYLSKESVPEMANLLDSLLDKSEVKALSAINMEYLAKVPMAESGISKSIDRDEANNTVHAICEDLVTIADEICEYIIEYRYTQIVPNKEEREKLNPSIAVPETYDLLNTSYLMLEMKAANESKMNALFLNKMQVEISGKKYPNDMNFVDTMECIFQTDPLSTFSVDEKLSMLQNKGITEEDFVVSCNIQQFIKTAIEEDDNFLNLPFLEKQSVIYQMATDKILSQKVGESIIKSIVSPVIPATVDDTTKDKIVTPVM